MELQKKEQSINNNLLPSPKNKNSIQRLRRKQKLEHIAKKFAEKQRNRLL
jgi:hypothetical protein